MFHGLGPLVYSDSGLISETTNPFRHFGIISWVGKWLNARPIPAKDSTKQKDMP
jgi:hypothetical protein